MALLIPWSAIEPVAGELARYPQRRTARRPAREPAVQRGLAEAQVLLRAEVGSVQMPVEEMLALAPGTLLTLDARAAEGVGLFAEGVALGQGKPGSARHAPRAQAHLHDAGHGRPAPANRGEQCGRRQGRR